MAAEAHPLIVSLLSPEIQKVFNDIFAIPFLDIERDSFSLKTFDIPDTT